jgi:hypothetical protein
MSPKDIAKSGAGCGAAESVAVQIDRALASLGNAESNLRELRSSSLDEMVQALALAASDLETLHSSLAAQRSSPKEGRRADGALRARVNKLRRASSRVCALYGAARAFHSGLALIRRMEAGAYDARGKVCGRTGGSSLPHRLETKG